MIDAHLHLRDRRIRSCHARFVRESVEAGVTGCIACTAVPEEWDIEVDCSWDVTDAFGAHPWAAGVLPPDWAEHLREVLLRHPGALVGEIGVDGIRRVHDCGALQRAVLTRQLELAVALGRPVVLHGARAWVHLFHAIEPYLKRLPAVLLHGVSFSRDLLTHPVLRSADRVWYSVSGAVCSPDAKTLPALAAALPLDRLLLETDSPDMFPVGGDPLVLGSGVSPYNSPANLPRVCATVARLRGIPAQELAEITASNARAFLARR